MSNPNFLDGLPPDLRAFVSSSRDVLEQFQDIGQHDRVLYRMFIDPDHSAGLSMDMVVSTFLTVHAFLRHNSVDYIWCRDIPTLRIVLFDDTTSGGNCDKEDSIVIKHPYFEGTFRYGESVDDEWYFLYLLMILTRSMPFLTVSCVDTDGQFILIEAADHIPSWLSPQNCTNRVWLRSGELHIIPQEVSGALSNGSVPLPAALSMMRNPALNFKVTSAVFGTVEARTTGVYPSLITKHKHNIVVCLPLAVAALLEEHPQLGADIVNSFCTSRNAAVNKTISSMVKVVHLLYSASSVKETKKNVSNLTSVRVTLTRLLYSKLVSRPFNVPNGLRKFQEDSFCALRALCAGCIGAAKTAAELSCRILCGFELLYQKLSALPKETLSPNKTLISLIEGSAKSNILSTDAALLTDAIFYKRSVGLANTNLESSDIKQVSDFSRYGHIQELYTFDAIDATLAKTDLSLTCVASLVDADSDAWLSLSPDELDSEMRSRAEDTDAARSSSGAKFEQSENTSATKEDFGSGRATKNAFSESDSKSSRKLHTEDIESADEETTDSDDDDDDDGNIGELDIDFERLFSIVNGDNSNANLKDTASETIGVGHGFLSTTHEKNFSSEPLVCQSDSDDEPSLSGEIEEDGFNAEVYALAMEEQLKGTTLDETFERDNDGQVDLDRNLFVNLLESHASQNGENGPVSLLMSQLGFKFPDNSN